jgi:hypothetical protein
VTDLTREALLAEVAQQESLLRALDRQRDEARARLEALREQVADAERARSQPPPVRPVPDQAALLRASELSPPTTGIDKLRLFRELFRGREDVYPKYWENLAKSKKGYSPACSNEWKPGLCDKKRVKCGACPHRAFIPVSDPVILDHFKGRHIMGVYPMLEDETCWFLAADFDKASWKDDVAVFVGTAPSAQHGVIRPAFPEPGHDAARRLRQPHRPAIPGQGAQAGQHPVPRRRLQSLWISGGSSQASRDLHLASSTASHARRRARGRSSAYAQRRSPTRRTRRRGPGSRLASPARS